MFRWCVVALLSGSALAGCDLVFGLTASRPPLDAPMIDAPTCVPMTQHDEDRDKRMDDCDPCPTVADGPMPLDSDHDGLYDSCDPDLSKSVDGDKILLASMFKSVTEITDDYVASGVNPVAQSNDRLILRPSSQVATKQVLLPTKLVAAVGAFSGSLLTDDLQVATSGASCSVASTGCANEAGQMCVTFQSPVTLPQPASSLREVAIWHDAGGNVYCQLTTAQSTMTYSQPGSFVAQSLVLRTYGNATAEIESFVVYGEK